MKKEKKTRMREKMMENLELPMDLVAGAAIVTVTGRREVLIENYKGILDLEDSFLKIQAKDCRIEVSGTHLSVEYYTNEEMKITGQIDAIRYEYA